MFTHAAGPFSCETGSESQGYRPRYAYVTSSDPVPPLSPYAQQERAIMLRWTLVTNSAPAPSGATGNASRDRCNKIFAGQPQNVSLTSIYRFCDALFLLQGAFSHAPSMTREGFVAGLASLGTSHLTSEGLGAARFGPGRLWGVATYAMATWNSSTRDWQFTGKPTPIPGS